MKRFASLFALTMLASSLSFAQLSSGLLVHHSFNDGTTASDIGGAHALNFGATSAPDRFGNAGKAREFHNAYMVVEHSSACDLNLYPAITISCWIRIDTFAFGNLGAIVAKWNNNPASEQYGLFLTSNNNIVAVGSANPNGVTDAANYALGTWYHVVTSYEKSNSEIRTFVQPGNYSYTSIAPMAYINTTDATHLSIGAQYNDLNGSNESPWRFFSGRIDDVRIYGRILNPGEIDSLYNEANPATSVASSQARHTIQLGPNPTNGLLHFDAQVHAQVRDLAGRTMLEARNVRSIDLGPLPAGTYMVTLTGRQGSETRRIVRE